MQKFIGTLVPMSALITTENKIYNGTLAAGINFLDWLKKTNQSAWQILPLNETQLEPGSVSKHVPSPYKGYGICMDPRYLPKSNIHKKPNQFEKKEFMANNKEWIDNYAFFCALRDHFQTDDWRCWGNELRNRNKAALVIWREKLAENIDKHIIIQWQLHQTYSLLKNKANKLGIMLIGDLPFYISLKSPLVWEHQDVFQIEYNRDLRFVSGSPNSGLAHFGRQVWGHPLYNWSNSENVIIFWKKRLGYLSKLFDKIRIDHAKAFLNYGVMDLENPLNDRYENGPGLGVFGKIISFCIKNNLSIFAEDSGEGVGELRKILNKQNLPGIKIFRFAFDEKKGQVNDQYANIRNFPANTVVYTSTHDTETLLGYLNKLDPGQKQILARTAGVDYDRDDNALAIKFRNAILNSPAQTVIIPIQDWLLTTDRINVPGTELAVDDPNWSYKLKIPVEDLPVKF